MYVYIQTSEATCVRVWRQRAGRAPVVGRCTGPSCPPWPPAAPRGVTAESAGRGRPWRAGWAIGSGHSMECGIRAAQPLSLALPMQPLFSLIRLSRPPLHRLGIAAPPPWIGPVTPPCTQAHKRVARPAALDQVLGMASAVPAMRGWPPARPRASLPPRRTATRARAASTRTVWRDLKHGEEGEAEVACGTRRRRRRRRGGGLAGGGGAGGRGGGEGSQCRT